MTYHFINKYYKLIDLNIEELLSIREELKEGNITTNLIKVLPYILGYNIKIFDCYSYDIDIIEYKSDNEEKYIYILKYLDKIDTLI